MSIQVLSTAKIPVALLREATEEGIDITVDAFIEIELIQSVEVQQEIEYALLQSAIVIFTSQNAVKAVAAELEGQEPDWTIYCVGQKTERLAASLFGEERVAGSADSAKELADELVDIIDGEEVIFFCGDQRMNDLPNTLSDNGIDVNEIIVYQTVAIPHKIDKVYNGILFFSPSAVHSFFKVNNPTQDIVFFATGNSTAAAVKKYSNHALIVCKQPGKDEMIREVIVFFSNE